MKIRFMEQTSEDAPLSPEYARWGRFSLAPELSHGGLIHFGSKDFWRCKKYPCGSLSMRKGIPVWAEIPLLVGLKPPLRWKSMKCFTKVQRFSRPTNLFPLLFLPILLFIRKRRHVIKST
jgi:hypothetical protein